MSKGNRKRRRKAGILPTAERCIARNRFGERCKKYPIEGATVCASHGGAAPQVRRKAQERIMMAQDDAASLLVRALSNEKIPFAERRRCAEFLLTYENRNEITLTLAKWEENIGELLVSYEPDEVDEDIVDAEIVEDHRQLPPSDVDWDKGSTRLAEDPPHYGRGNRLRGR
ncbi:hypothetical protein [Nocardioides caricicola]|uniref:Uncharacterized protein n=1 Tax=Nocardioides caricicola TaxID=634770 RepID=A0ABW0N0W2_9ACTN